ncbi:hypothetical protein BP5796_09618 [Coleophoma crateriformis]|uniref:VLRF1 domain-containing protein n=1 Tax=Coleophoma crateriformis TaxID=565419 RepID=A0A3D8QYK4_9HELO|nr:hypothetical protein BP5796_09618 [Coleophoma crateriformis]
MDQRKEEVTRRPLYVYDLPQDILATLERADATGLGPVATDLEDDSPVPETILESKAENGGSKSCSLCGVTFPTLEDQRSHNRSDLHSYNLKQKVRGAKPVSEVEFESLIKDLNESLSGSDSSSDEDEETSTRKETTLSALLKKQAAISSNNNTEEEDNFARKTRKQGSGKAPLLWFSTPTLPPNTYLGFYRAIFTNEEQENDSNALDIIKKKQLAPKPQPKPAEIQNGIPLPSAYTGPHFFLCMIGGGHFAAMVVSLAPKQTKSASGPMSREATVLAHKTFHRYTTRRKQGGAQSANDSAKGAAHSAGSSLRRYNEQALTEEVRLLLQDWKGMIDTSELLFIRATGNTNRRTLFGPYEGQVLRQNDARIRGFPFNTRRATQSELMRSYIELTRVKVTEIDVAAISAAKAAAEEAARQSAAAKAAKKVAPAAPKISEEEEIALLHTSQVQALIRRSKLPALLSYLSTNEISPDFVFHPKDTQQNHHAPTALHLAASQNSPPLVTGLLIKAGANPTIRNGDGKTPFELAGDRSTRDTFRVARSELGKDKWDWDAACVPAPLTRKEADERDARERMDEAKKENARRKAEEERLKEEGPKVTDDGKLGRAAGRGRSKVLGQAYRNSRQEEVKGLTPEQI